MFDISTIARSTGPPVGIVRVERALAQRATAFLDRTLYEAWDIAVRDIYQLIA